jgi:hypothetical protein
MRSEAMASIDKVQDRGNYRIGFEPQRGELVPERSSDRATNVQGTSLLTRILYATVLLVSVIPFGIPDGRRSPSARAHGPGRHPSSSGYWSFVARFWSLPDLRRSTRRALKAGSIGAADLAQD